MVKELKAENDIGLYITNSHNGWATKDVIIAWLEKILLPFVGKEHCLLVWDSYEAHHSAKVLTFLESHSNIHIVIIAGGRTSLDQPLDLAINRRFKAVCRKESVAQMNHLLEFMGESNRISELYKKPNENLIKSKSFFFLDIKMIVNNQTIMAQKDKGRSTGKKQVTITSLMAKITVEEIYGWIKKAFNEIRQDPDFIKQAFYRSGFVVDPSQLENQVKSEIFFLTQLQITQEGNEENKAEEDGSFQRIPIEEEEEEEFDSGINLQEALDFAFVVEEEEEKINSNEIPQLNFFESEENECNFYFK